MLVIDFDFLESIGEKFEQLPDSDLAVFLLMFQECANEGSWILESPIAYWFIDSINSECQRRQMKTYSRPSLDLRGMDGAELAAALLTITQLAKASGVEPFTAAANALTWHIQDVAIGITCERLTGDQK